LAISCDDALSVGAGALAVLGAGAAGESVAVCVVTGGAVVAGGCVPVAGWDAIRPAITMTIAVATAPAATAKGHHGRRGGCGGVFMTSDAVEGEVCGAE